MKPQLTQQAEQAGFKEFLKVAIQVANNTQQTLIGGREYFDDPEAKNLINKVQATFKYAAQDLKLLSDYLNRPKYEKDKI